MDYIIDFQSDIDKSDIPKIKNVSTNLSNLKSKIGKLVVDKFKAVPVDFNEMSDS